jgi:large subunit ribosomal protein L10
VRKGFRESKVEYRVVKNTLAKLSLNKAGISGLDKYLSGVNSYAIGYDDPILPIKVFEKFKKQLDGKLAIKVAYFEGEIIAPEKVGMLAKLPSLNEIRGQLVGLLKAPASRLVGTLQAPAAKLIGVFKALENKENK